MRDIREGRGRYLLVPALLFLLGLTGCAADDAGAGETPAAPQSAEDPAPAPAQGPPSQGPPAQGPPAQGPTGPAQDRIEEVSAVTVSLVDIAFEPDRLELPAGQPVNLTVRNEGQLEHDFDLPEADLHLHTFPGGEQAATFMLDEPGVYEARCLIPGHAEAGMVMDVVVG